jgi:leader peptidase (prepilin peptidase) / N-methyltransferase
MLESDVLASWVWPVAIAPIIGSFLTVVVTRLDQPTTILWGRSRCPACNAVLRPFDLVPVLSWLALGGRCRHCGVRIDALYPMMEVAAIAIAAWAAFQTPGATIWATVLLGWTLLALAVCDFKYYLLPDFLTLPLLAAGLVANWLLDPSRLTAAAIGAAAGLLFVITLRQAYWLLRRREGIGLGDAKLLAAAGAWVSWEGLPSVVLLAAIFGLASILLRYRRGGNPTLGDRVPFGAYLCLGLWLIWLYGPLT